MTLATPRKVLMICYYFPPLGGIPVQRTLRYVKYLARFDWEPTVLAARNSARDEAVRDEALLSQIPAGTKVVRTFYLDLTLVYLALRRMRLSRLAYYATRFIHLFPPDHCVGWIPFAYLAARRVIEEEGIDVIYTQSAPFSGHLVGNLLKKSTGKPWVADFRDEWTQSPTRFKPLFGWQRALDLWMEQLVLRTADRVITTTETFRREMASLVSSEMDSKFVAITNGYDAAHFEPGLVIPKASDKLTFVYAGMFYGPHQPTHLLKAMKELVAEGNIPVSKLELVFVGGTGGGPGLGGSNTSGIDTMIRNVGIVPHREAVRWMMEADVLWLAIGKGRGKGNIVGKAFEYIASGKPILALAPPDGETAALLRKTNTAAAIVAPDDVQGIKSAIMQLYEKWALGELRVDPDWSEVHKHEGKVLTGRMVEILEQLLISEKQRIERTESMGGKHNMAGAYSHAPNKSAKNSIIKLAPWLLARSIYRALNDAVFSTFTWKRRLIAHWGWDVEDDPQVWHKVCAGYDRDRLESYSDSIIWLLNPSLDDVCLNVGCGVGRVDKFLSAKAKQIHSVDFSAPMIKVARERCKDCLNVYFYQNDGQSLSMFPSNKFDLAWSELVFQHVPVIVTRRYIKEIYRVLKPGGRFICQIPKKEKYSNYDRKVCGWMDREEVTGIFRTFGKVEFIDDEFYYIPLATK